MFDVLCVVREWKSSLEELEELELLEDSCSTSTKCERVLVEMLGTREVCFDFVSTFDVLKLVLGGRDVRLDCVSVLDGLRWKLGGGGGAGGLGGASLKTGAGSGGAGGGRKTPEGRRSSIIRVLEYRAVRGGDGEYVRTFFTLVTRAGTA